MQVTIITSSNNFPTEISHQEPVLEIKQKITKILGIPVPLQTLFVFGFEQIDGLDMYDNPIIHEGTRIDLIISIAHDELPPRDNYSVQRLQTIHHNKISVTIKFSSRQSSIVVDSITETVKSLKEKIHTSEGTPIKRMLLYSSGVEMEDEFRYLSEYGVTEYSEITVLLKNMNRIKDEPLCRKLSMVVQTSKSLLNTQVYPWR